MSTASRDRHPIYDCYDFIQLLTAGEPEAKVAFAYHPDMKERQELGHGRRMRVFARGIGRAHPRIAAGTARMTSFA